MKTRAQRSQRKRKSDALPVITGSKLKKVGKKYKLCLYVTGATSRSAAAVANLKALCDKYLPDNYELQIIDIYQKPELVKQQQLIAAPTLIKEFPLPLRKFIGDMSDTRHLLAGLEVNEQ